MRIYHLLSLLYNHNINHNNTTATAMSITDILQLTPRTLADLNARDGEDIPAEDAKDIFDLFDKDGDGSIPTQEIGTAIRSLGFYPKEAELSQIVDLAEEVNFDQFLRLISRWLHFYIGC